MAEAIALIGLASSIITFLDLSQSLIKAAKSARDTWHGTTPQVHELDLIVTDIEERTSVLLQSQVSSGKSQSKFDRNTMAMAKECAELAKELQKLVTNLSRRTDARSQTIETGRVALRALMRQSEMKDIGSRLKSLDAAVRLNVSEVLKGNRHAEVVRHLKSLEQSHSQLGIKYDIKLEELRSSILSLAVQNQDDLAVQGAQLTSLGTKLSSLEKEMQCCQTQTTFIQSLYFPEIKRRWTQIPESETMTNLWLFDSSQTSFPSWLKGEESIYCITGLAGSGKSTLMKYAFDHEITHEALKEWAHPADLCVASYFFWNQGFEMQKSQLGLLQSLLYQILRNIPALIPHVTTNRLDHEVWTFDELKDVFDRIVAHSELTTRFCFFIDGLDEYNGEEEEIAKLLLAISTSKAIKICASSRPRLVFNNTLWSPTHTLQVNDFTRPDMQNYVRKRLRENQKFKRLEGTSGLASQALMNQVAEQAKGVWLWVYLITRDLVYAVNRNEGLSKLRDIVDGFPKELNEYFTLIISRVRPAFRDEMARIFLVTLQEVQPMPLFAFSLLEQEAKNPNYAVEAHISVIDDVSVMEADELWKDRIQNRCSDLLVVDPGEHPTFLWHPVDFLHRTVRDFLRDCYFHKLQVELKSDFSPAVSLSKMLLFFLKKQPHDNFRSPSTQNRIISLVDELLYHAREAEKMHETGHMSLERILDELDQVVVAFAKGSTKNHWTHARDSPRARGMDEYREGGKCNYVALTVQARLVKYVQAKLEADPERIQKGGRPLLDYALRPRRISPLMLPYHSQRDEPNIEIDMVRLLLKYGADPNQQIHLNDGRLVWQMFLISCGESISREEASEASRRAWLVAMELLLEHGAMVNSSETGVRGFKHLKGLVNVVFGHDQGARMLSKLLENEQEQKSAQSWTGWFRGLSR